MSCIVQPHFGKRGKRRKGIRGKGGRKGRRGKAGRRKVESVPFVLQQLPVKGGKMRRRKKEEKGKGLEEKS